MLNISVSLLNKIAEHTDTMPCSTVPLTGGHDGYPPPFDLAQLRVRHLNLEGQSRDPHVELQLSAQVSVGEVHHHPHFALHLLAIHKNVVTPVWHLRGKRGKDQQTAFKLGSSDGCTRWLHSELHSAIYCTVCAVGQALWVDYKALHSWATRWYRIPVTTLNKMKGPLSAPHSLRKRGGRAARTSLNLRENRSRSALLL